ncbi:MAG: AMP-binding protein, partial [Geobacter sp.]|nr:AMP-binding protein [Geobacter sp.]
INVYPDELETVLLRTPGVKDACVIGFDRGTGEEVHAVLVADDSGRALDDIIAEANRSLDELHRITGFTRWPEPELPKTTTLKVQKFLVRKRLLEAMTAGSDAAVSSDKLCLLIAQVLGVAPAEVKDESYLVADLGLTSIARLELANAIEQEFRMDMDDAAIGVQTRVADLRVMIARREKSVQPPGLRLWAVSGLARLLRRVMDSVLHYPLYRIFVSLRQEGAENLAELSSPVMFIANHVSYLDQPTIMFALPPELRYRTATAAWAEFFFPGAVAPLMRLWKRAAFEYCAILMSVFPLPQSSGFRASMQHMGRLVDRGNSLLLFPEGERTEDGTLLPFRQGLGVMVQELGIPVIPVAIKGLEEVMPRGANWPKKGAVRVIFGAPLDFSGKSAAEIVRVSEAAVKKLTGS